MATRKRLRVVAAGISYPHPTDAAIVERAGGRRHLTAEQFAKLKKREIWPKPGDWCDDVPEISREWLLEDGYIEEVEVEEPPRRASKKTSAGKR